jgi:hypothetical protein
MSTKITCAVTGKSYSFGKDYFTKRASVYGDEEMLRSNFVVRKALTYLNRGYSVEETRKFLDIEPSDDLLSGDHPDMLAIINFHKIKSRGSVRKQNFATHKSDDDVVAYINNIKDYE